MIGFTKEELSRYSRHFLLKECGVEGQNRIRRGRVLIVGAGGLGSPVALYLAAAGVGTIGIADGDVVDLSNLQRQVIHTTADVGRPKVESACERIKAINPHVIAEPICDLLNEANAADIIRNYDFIVDATDNLAAYCVSRDIRSRGCQARPVTVVFSEGNLRSMSCRRLRKPVFLGSLPAYWAPFRRPRH